MAISTRLTRAPGHHASGHLGADGRDRRRQARGGRVGRRRPRLARRRLQRRRRLVRARVRRRRQPGRRLRVHHLVAAAAAAAAGRGRSPASPRRSSCPSTIPSRSPAASRPPAFPLFCQLQTRADAERAIDCGADVIVAQGTEGGGHGGTRATLTLVPEIADLIAKRAPQTLLCAAGGIADGRGLAAALMLGADGVVVGTRFWASQEALVHPNLHAAALAAGGDDTVRQSVLDIVRGRPWPARYTGRVLENDFVARMDRPRGRAAGGQGRAGRALSRGGQGRRCQRGRDHRGRGAWA